MPLRDILNEILELLKILTRSLVFLLAFCALICAWDLVIYRLSLSEYLFRTGKLAIVLSLPVFVDAIYTASKRRRHHTRGSD